MAKSIRKTRPDKFPLTLHKTGQFCKKINGKLDCGGRVQEKHCNDTDAGDSPQGDNWDHVAYDSEHRLVVSVVPGKRTAKNVEKLVADFKKRTADRIMNLITSDEYKPYKKAILKAYGRVVNPQRTGKPGRPKGSGRVPAKGLKYATVHKTRRKGRVVKIDLRTIFGSETQVEAAIEASTASRMINTAFIERHNGTDRNRNARKVRKSYCFSKDWDVHNAVTYFAMDSYNSCWPVRTLRIRDENDRWLSGTPAMVAGLTDHIWSLREWLTYPAVQLT